MTSSEIGEDVHSNRLARLEELEAQEALVDKHFSREKILKTGKYVLSLTPVTAAAIFGETHLASEMSRVQLRTLDILSVCPAL